MNANDTLARLAEVIETRKAGDPDKSYVARLFQKGTDAILKKIGEEATETVMAAKDARIDGKTDTDTWFLYDVRGPRVAAALELVEWSSPALARRPAPAPARPGLGR